MTKMSLKIAIIGAGLGGLCLAQGLKKVGIYADVYEQDPRLDKRGQGYRIRIDPTGQEALKACLPIKLYSLFIDTCSLNQSTGYFVNSQLEPIAGRPSSNWQPSANSGQAGDLSVNRKTLREILMQGLEKQTHFGKEFESYHQDSRQISFKCGTKVPADIVIGADGTYSRVREQFFPGLQPKDNGAVCIYGSAPWTKEISPLLSEGTTVVFGNSLTCIIDAMRFNQATWQMLTPVDDYIYWAIVAPHHYFSLGNITNQLDMPKLTKNLISDWHADLRSLFNLTPSESVYFATVRSSPLPIFSAIQNIILIGDALHTMSPAGGVGANTALEDAQRLTNTLINVMKDQSYQSLTDYHLQMIPRTTQALSISEEGTTRLLSEG